MNLYWNLLAVSAGFITGTCWLYLKDHKRNLDTVSFAEYNRLVTRVQRLGIKDYYKGEQLYLIELKVAEYAAHKHTVYRKVARELNAILSEHDNF